MIVTANAHIGFNCKDLDRTQKFYEDVLDCREKSPGALGADEAGGGRKA